jgi:hypothetical protein
MGRSSEEDRYYSRRSGEGDTGTAVGEGVVKETQVLQ